MAGYSHKPLIQKLGIKAGHQVLLLHPPPGFRTALEPLPEEVILRSSGATSEADVILLFARDLDRFRAILPATAEALASGAMLWIAWPKKSSGVVTDLSDNVVREMGLNTGLVDVKVCAIDETWSGLKFVHRRAQG